jgi:hypothetical protein
VDRPPPPELTETSRPPRSQCLGRLALVGGASCLVGMACILLLVMDGTPLPDVPRLHPFFGRAAPWLVVGSLACGAAGIGTGTGNGRAAALCALGTVLAALATALLIVKQF